jgi:1-acyl-sn-glycerol-3-phosphate acyltransferase
MGRLTVNGLDALSDDFAALARLPDSVVDGILNAEADVIVQAQRAEIEKQWSGPHSLGISSKSVKKGKAKKERDGRSISVYPKGTRKRGGQTTRNAEIAFINECGAPGRHIAARPAIDAANKKKEKEAVDAGERVYSQFLDSKNL